MIYSNKGINPYLLSLAAEFAVASELCRRNIYAQPTFGNRKKVDLLIETDNKMLRVQVKAKQRREWRNVKGIGKEDIMIFVDYENKATERPDFYILTFDDWKKLVKKKVGWDKGVELDKDTYTAHWSDWDGIEIAKFQLKDHFEKWDKIKSIVGT